MGTSDPTTERGAAHVSLLGATLIWLIFSLLLAAITLTLVNRAQWNADGQRRAESIGAAAIAAASGGEVALRRLVQVDPDLHALELSGSGGEPVQVGSFDAGDRAYVVHVNGDVIRVGLSPAAESAFRLHSAMGILAALGLVFLLMSVFLVVVSGRMVGRPVLVLRQRAARLASGDLRPPAGPFNAGEFGGVASAMEDVRLRMEQERTQQERTAEELQRTNSLQRLMLRELNHRIRNNLASLSSLVAVSRVGETRVADFASRIDRRVAAMSAVHALLSERQWSPVALHDLIRRLAPVECVERMTMEGAEFMVGASQATPLALVLQELFANAMEHGSLASGAGWLKIHWDIAGDASGGDVLVLQWRESGGAPPDPNAEAGTGTTLIRGLVEGELRGDVRLQHAPDGVAHELRIPCLPSAGG